MRVAACRAWCRWAFCGKPSHPIQYPTDVCRLVRPLDLCMCPAGGVYSTTTTTLPRATCALSFMHIQAYWKIAFPVFLNPHVGFAYCCCQAGNSPLIAVVALHIRCVDGACACEVASLVIK
eukprot:366364-Chlamydomonas_euryale.AAC.2